MNLFEIDINKKHLIYLFISSSFDFFHLFLL